MDEESTSVCTYMLCCFFAVGPQLPFLVSLDNHREPPLLDRLDTTAQFVTRGLVLEVRTAVPIIEDWSPARDFLRRAILVPGV
jgi:hypothetical protein